MPAPACIQPSTTTCSAAAPPEGRRAAEGAAEHPRPSPQRCASHATNAEPCPDWLGPLGASIRPRAAFSAHTETGCRTTAAISDRASQPCIETTAVTGLCGLARGLDPTANLFERIRAAGCLGELADRELGNPEGGCPALAEDPQAAAFAAPRSHGSLPSQCCEARAVARVLRLASGSQAAACLPPHAF